MNWDAIGAVGEIVGAVAVLVTLLYLATQIRNQNRQARDANRQFGVAQFNALRLITIDNPEVARIAVEGLQTTTELSPVERYQFTQRMLYTFATIWSQYTSIQAGTSDMDIGMLRIGMESLGSSPVVLEVWSEIRGGYPEDFTSFVDEAIGGGT